MKDGKVNIDVKSNHTIIMLTENNIQMLKKFHFLLFNNIVPFMKKFMIFDNDNLENSFLIVPCKYDSVIIFMFNMHININKDY